VSIAEPNIFLRICTQTITINNDLWPPMPTHAHVLPVYTKSWLDRTNKRSFIVVGFNPKRFLISVFLASEKFDSDLELDVRMHKTDAYPCPPMNNNIAPMPTQNPWAWVGMGMGMGMGTQCWALEYSLLARHVLELSKVDDMTLSTLFQSLFFFKEKV
jgi:hypothetical protein